MKGVVAVCAVTVAACASTRVERDAPPAENPDSSTSSPTPDATAAIDAAPDATVDAGAGACDSFSIADSTTIPGWTERGGDWFVDAGRVRHTATGGVYSNVMTRDGSTMTDGCVRARALYGVGPAQVQAIGIVLRWTPPNSYVVALVQDNTYVGQFDKIWIYEYPNIDQIGMLDGAFGQSPQIEACVTGASLTMKVDTAADGTFETQHVVTTAVQGAGLVGLMMHTFGNPAFADDHCLMPP